MRNAVGALVTGLVLAAGCSSGSSSEPAAPPPTHPDANPRSVEMVVKPVIELEDPPCDEGAPVSGTSHAPGCYDLGRVIAASSDVATTATRSVDATRRRWIVDAHLSTSAAESFAKWLREFVYQRLAVVIDGKVVSTVRATPGLDPHVLRIDGGFDEKTADRIASGLVPRA